MAKIKNVSGEDRLLAASAGGGLVQAGQVIEVDDDAVFGFTQQSIWEAVDKAAKDAHGRGEQARDERVTNERARSTINVVPARREGEDE